MTPNGIAGRLVAKWRTIWGDWVDKWEFMEAPGVCTRLKLAGDIQEAIEQGVSSERQRCLNALTLATNGNCSCGGGGPEDSHSCDVCKAYHTMKGLIERGNDVDPR